MGLREKTARGVAWSAVQIWGTRVSTTVVFALLARLLAPEEIGLAALATALVSFFALFGEQGFTHALVQRADLEPEHLDSAVWFAFGTGVVLLVLLQLAAQPLAAALGQPQLEPLLRWLSLNFLFGAGKSAPMALLKRELRFAPFAVRSLCATAVGGVAGVWAALAGLGVRALVVQSLVQTGVSAVALWTACGWRPRLRFSSRHLRELVPFSTKALGHEVLSYSNRHADDFLIGALLGPVALGYYAVAYRVLTALMELFSRTISTVTLPAFARVQDDHGRLRNGLYAASRLCALSAFPAFLGVGALAPELTEIVFGPQWADSVAVMRPLAVVGALQSIMFFNGNVMMAVGRAGWNVALDAAGAALNLAAILLAISMGWGILGVSLALAARWLLFFPLPLLALRRLVQLDIARYLRQILPTAAAAVLMAGAVLAATGLLAPALNGPLRLAAGAAVGLLTYGLLVCWWAGPLPREALSYVRLVLPSSHAR